MSNLLKSWRKQQKVVNAPLPKEKLGNAQLQKSVNLLEKKSENDENVCERFDDLQNFCQHLEYSIKIANEVLDRAYADEYPNTLRQRLKNDVTELMCLQNEIKTILDNIASMKMQIVAVKSNIEDHKEKAIALRSEERRTRFLLFNESNKQNKKKNIQKDAINGTKFYIAPSSSATSSTIRRGYITLPGVSDSDSGLKTIRSGGGSKIPVPTVLKRNRFSRQKNDTPGEETGITLFLHPINEETRSEDNASISRRPSTPNNSIANFSWFESQIDQNEDPATDSIISDSNSLLVLSSNGRIDDAD